MRPRAYHIILIGGGDEVNLGRLECTLEDGGLSCKTTNKGKEYTLRCWLQQSESVVKLRSLYTPDTVTPVHHKHTLLVVHKQKSRTT